MSKIEEWSNGSIEEKTQTSTGKTKLSPDSAFFGKSSAGGSDVGCKVRTDQESEEVKQSFADMCKGYSGHSVAIKPTSKEENKKKIADEDDKRSPIIILLAKQYPEEDFDKAKNLLKESSQTIKKLQKEENSPKPDLTDRATEEIERSFELRTRDRERKLITKINAALKRIEDGIYGYCEETGDPINIKRLEARPIATLSLEAQEAHERKEKIEIKT